MVGTYDKDDGWNARVDTFERLSTHIGWNPRFALRFLISIDFQIQFDALVNTNSVKTLFFPEFQLFNRLTVKFKLYKHSRKSSYPRSCTQAYAGVRVAMRVFGDDAKT